MALGMRDASFHRRRFFGLWLQGPAAGILALAWGDGAVVLGVDEATLAVGQAGQQQGVAGGAGGRGASIISISAMCVVRAIMV